MISKAPNIWDIASYISTSEQFYNVNELYILKCTNTNRNSLPFIDYRYNKRLLVVGMKKAFTFRGKQNEILKTKKNILNAKKTVLNILTKKLKLLIVTTNSIIYREVLKNSTKIYSCYYTPNRSQC